MIIVLLILWLTNGNINIIFAWLLSSLVNQSINISSCATEYLILFWYVTGVAWQVFLVVFDECLGSHF
jgi:hypothetical protein